MTTATFNHTDRYGATIPVLYDDNGDGTYSIIYASAIQGGGVTTKTFIHTDRYGASIPVQYVDNGDGTFSPTAGGVGGGGVNAAVTPTPGGPNDASVLLNYGTTFVLPGANGGDGLQLPPAKAGTFVQLVRQANAAAWVAVFVNNGSGDTVNGIQDQIDWQVSQDTALSPPLFFICSTDGAWNTNGELD